MTLNQNQFAPSPVQGQMDLLPNWAMLGAEVDNTSGGNLAAGTPVKLVDEGSGGSLPTVVEAALDTDDIFGFIAYDIKNSDFDAGDRCNVAFGRGAVMWMTAGAAIARWAKVGVIIASTKVQTAASTDRIIGRALDKAEVDGDLIRVWIDLPGDTV